MPITYQDLYASVSNGCLNQAKIALRDLVTGAWPDQTTIDTLFNWAAVDALIAVGFPPATPSAVGDSDVAAVPDALLGRLMLLALIQAKRRIRGQLTLIDASQGSTKQFLSQLAQQIDRELVDLIADLKARFGLRATPPALTPMTSASDPGGGGIIRGRAAPIVSDGGPPITSPPDPYGGFEFA